MRALIISALALAACGKRETVRVVHVPAPAPTPVVGERGEKGEKGESVTGPAGKDGESIVGPAGETGRGYELKTLTLEADRFYNPSTWSNDERVVQAGTYMFPQTIVAEGNAGTGWLTIKLGAYSLCYQGAAANNNQSSLQFKLKGYKSSAEPCESGAPVASQPVLFATEQTTLSLSINGGGCGSICQTTSVEVNVTSTQLENE